ASFLVDRDSQALDLLGGLLSRALVVEHSFVVLLFLFGQAPHVRVRRLVGESLREEIVAGISGLDGDGVAAMSQAPHVVGENDLHNVFVAPWPRFLKSVYQSKRPSRAVPAVMGT